MKKRAAVLYSIIVAALAFSAPCSSEPSASQHPAGGNAYMVVVSGFDPGWKIQGIKSVRAVTGLGLADAKTLLEQTPSVLKSGLDYAEAETIKRELEKSRLEVQIMTKH